MSRDCIICWPGAKSYEVNIDDGFLNLESKAGDPKDDVKVPGGDIGTNLSNDFESGKDLRMPHLSLHST